MTLTGLQVSLHDLRPPLTGRAARNLFPDHWLNLFRPVRSQAHIAFDRTCTLGPLTALPTCFSHTRPEPFAFGPVATLPARHRIQSRKPHPCARWHPRVRGLATTLPEWNASAVSWALVLALHTASDILLPDARRDWVVRVTRV